MHNKSVDALENQGSVAPLLPRGLIVFRTWKTLRWYLLLAAPVFVSAGVLYLNRRQLWGSAGILLLGLSLAFALVVELISGMASATSFEMYGLFFDGTFSRSRNPILYWIQVGFTASAYLLVVVLGFVLSRGKPIMDSTQPLQSRRVASEVLVSRRCEEPAVADTGLWLCQQFWHHPPMHISQTHVAAAVAEDELLMVEAELMQNRGVDVVDFERVLHGRVAEVVGRAEREP